MFVGIIESVLINGLRVTGASAVADACGAGMGSVNAIIGPDSPCLHCADFVDRRHTSARGVATLFIRLLPFGFLGGNYSRFLLRELNNC